MTAPACTIELLKESHRAGVLATISKAFTSEDPLATSQGIVEADFHKFIDTLYPDFLHCGQSYVAVDPALNRVAAVLLADTQVSAESEEGSDAIASIIAAARAKYFAICPPVPCKSLHIHFIASHPDYRGQQLVQRLVAACLDNAGKYGFQRAMVEASGIRSRNLFKNHFDFSERVSIDYGNFEWQETFPFASIAHHGGLTLMDKALL